MCEDIVLYEWNLAAQVWGVQTNTNGYKKIGHIANYNIKKNCP